MAGVEAKRHTFLSLALGRKELKYFLTLPVYRLKYSSTNRVGVAQSV